MIIYITFRIATEYHLGILKAKLAKYRQDLIDIKTAAGGGKVKKELFITVNHCFFSF